MNAGFVSGLLALGMSFLASSALAALRIEVDKSAQTLTVTRDGETYILGRSPPAKVVMRRRPAISLFSEWKPSIFEGMGRCADAPFGIFYQAGSCHPRLIRG